MPEEPEVETERLHEASHEELEKEGGALLERIALTTAVLAALTRQRPVWFGSMLVGLAGIALFALARAH